MAADIALRRFAHSIAAQLPESPEDALRVVEMLTGWLDDEMAAGDQPRARLVVLAGSARPSRARETSNAIPLVRPR